MKQAQVTLAYGHQQVLVDIPAKNLLGVFCPDEITETVDEDRVLQEALANPTGTPPLREIVHPGQKIAIVTSDITRPTPSAMMMQAIAAELEAAGIPDTDVVVVLSLGLHRPMTDEEIDEILSPEYHRRYTVLNHDPEDTVRLGVTARGTPRQHNEQVKYCKSKGVRAYPEMIVDGNISQEILVFAKKKSVDLIVIGSHGLHGISKLKSLGSVSRKIAEYAHCPVLIVR